MISNRPQFPSRPQLSKNFKGKKITLFSNHFSLSLSPKRSIISLYAFRIFNSSELEIESSNKSTREKILSSARVQLEKLFGLSYWHSGANIWSFENFDEIRTLEVDLDYEHYSLTFHKARQIKTDPESLKNCNEVFRVQQYVNVLIKRFLMSNNYTEMGGNAKFYKPDEEISLGQKVVELFVGFKTSCEVAQNNQLQLLIDFSCRVVRFDTVLEFMKTCKTEEEMRDQLIGRSVVPNYKNNKTYVIHDIDFSQSPAKMMINERNMNLCQYFKDRYNYEIKVKTQCLLISYDRRSKSKTYLVPEMMRMTGLSDEMREDFKVMRDLSTFTKKSPDDRLNAITNNMLTPLAKDFIKNNNIEVKANNKTNGYLLAPREVKIGKDEVIQVDRGTFQIRGPIYSSALIGNWLLVYPEMFQDEAGYLLSTLKKCAPSLGVKLTDPKQHVSIKGKTPNHLIEALKSAIKPETQIVVCMFPPKASQGWYKALKDVCCVGNPVPSSAVLTTTLKEKNAMAVGSNILTEMCSKIGCIPWIVRKPAGLPKKTMVIGADVYHKTSMQNKSCVGFSASLDDDFTDYFNKTSFQKPGEELMRGISEMVREAVEKYLQKNKCYPECIIFYRDGVSDGQRIKVLEFETQAICQYLSTLEPKVRPKFAEIIVTKRIDDRVFQGGQGEFAYKNPYAGTVVIEDIVSDNFDFLMVAQNVNQGSCTPTKYFCIYNDTGLSQDVFLELTYSLCYNYYNWKGGIRVPAPVQFAHKIAYLTGDTLKQPANKALETKLFFL